MNTMNPAARLPAAGVMLFLLVLVTPIVGAQPDPVPHPNWPLGITLTPSEPFVTVPYNANIQTAVILYDASGDAPRDPTTGRPTMGFRQHQTFLEITNKLEIEAAGWAVNFPTVQNTFPGESVELLLSIATTPQIREDEIVINISAVYYDATADTSYNASATLGAQVARFERAQLTILTPPQKASQFDSVVFRVEMLNDGVYPERYRIVATTDKETFTVISPPNLYAPPGEARTFDVTVRTPAGRLYERGDTAIIAIKVFTIDGSGVYSTTTSVRVEGFYVPIYWLPLLVVGVVSAGVLMRSSRERRALRRLEKGRARRVEPTPRQAVLLKQLKRDDPEEYAAYKARMDALYGARRERYKAEREGIRKADAEERRRAKAEYAAAKKRRKQKKREAREAAKVQRVAEKRQAKIDRKAAKVQAKADAKERKRLEKELGKKRKVLTKAKAKADKAEAKQAKLDAKAEAKAAKIAAKAAKQAARAAKRNKP